MWFRFLNSQERILRQLHPSIKEINAKDDTYSLGNNFII